MNCNKIYRITRAAGILSLTLLTACNNFDDINTNPDSITKASASMLCTNIILGNLASGGDNKAYLQPNGLAKYIGYANEKQLEEQYNSLGSCSFERMTQLPNIEKMVEYAEGTTMENSYKGVAKFSRAYLFYKLTMRVGDIPYSETNQGAIGHYRPAYDTQKDVLLGILDELKEADAYFADGVHFEGDPTPFAGDPVKWRRASNAFALRILMSMSKKEGDASLKLKERFSEIVNGGQLLTDADGFLGLEYNSINKHPLSGTNDLFTSRTVISSLLLDELKRLNDRRLFYFAEPAAIKVGNGMDENEWDAYVGVDAAMDYALMTNEYLKGAYSLLNVRYLKDATCEPRMMVSYAEQQFILAEARIRGWITVGSAEKYYKSGVEWALKMQMETKGNEYAHGMEITPDYIAGYFTGEAAFKNTAEEQLKQIWMQRYIFNFMQDAEESYFEYRRNKYPEFPIDPNTNLNLENTSAIPMKWLYPASETNYNRENLEAALNSQYGGYDEVNKLMWILTEN